MKYLIFRTDRIGDFLITLPLLKSIKRNKKNSKIAIVASPKNIEFIKKIVLVDEVFLLKSNNFMDKFRLFLKLRKYSYDTIIVSDKKNRSIFLSLFLNATKKVFNVSKNSQKKLLSLFFKNIFIDNDELQNLPVKEILKNNCEALNIDFNSIDYKIFEENQFINEFNLKKIIDLEKLKYVVFHYDEKWELENYSKLFKKAKNLTDLNIDKNSFIQFLNKLSEKTSMNIIITTGYLNTNILNEIKKNSIRINKSLYEINLNKDKKFFLVIDQDFFSMLHIISKSNLFISCHGAFTHIASNYDIKILDIIEENKKKHYSRITDHMNNYRTLYRKNCLELFNEIINCS